MASPASVFFPPRSPSTTRSRWTKTTTKTTTSPTPKTTKVTGSTFTPCRSNTPNRSRPASHSALAPPIAVSHSPTATASTASTISKSASRSWATSTLGESFTTYSPGFFFGKAFGNLADQSSFLRPFAVTGQIALNLPEGDNARSLTTAFSLQYSLNYLEAFVKNVGLPHPLHNALLLVEIPLDTCLDHGCDGDVTGTVNPGIMFFNGQGQLTAEAVLPVNDRTGDSVGFLLQVHLYLDDLFPHSLGRPIFHRGAP